MSKTIIIPALVDTKWYKDILPIIDKCMTDAGFDLKNDEEKELESMTLKVASLSKNIHDAYFNPVLTNDMDDHQKECDDRINECMEVLNTLKIYNKNFGF